MFETLALSFVSDVPWHNADEQKMFEASINDYCAEPYRGTEYQPIAKIQNPVFQTASLKHQRVQDKNRVRTF